MKSESLLSGGRGRWAWVVCLLPSLSVLLMDLLLRASRMHKFTSIEWLNYAASFVESIFVWALLLWASAQSQGKLRYAARALFAVFFTISLGGQAYFFQQNGAYLNRHVSQFATNFRESVLNQLLADAGNYLSFKLPAFILCLLLLYVAQAYLPQQARNQRSQRLLNAAAFLTFFASFIIPTQAARRQASSPDMLYMEAMGEMFKTQWGFGKNSHKLRPRPRKSLPVASIEAQPQRPRNVVFVLLESVRADATCEPHEADCQRTEASHLAFPERTNFPQLRSLDSCTSISMAVLFSGVGPQESREVLHTWPLLFDYAQAAGYYTAYFTSQNLMFGNMRLWLSDLAVNQRFSALDVDPESHMDMGAPEDAFTERAIKELAQLQEPYFLTIQLSNGHYPYLVQEHGPQPFQPSTTSKAPQKNAEFFNHYQNAVHQEDAHLTRLLNAIRQSPGGENTVIVYTSDHGEAFREHHQMGHTFSLYDEEVHVPGWIDAPAGTLSERERALLDKNAESYLFHPDLSVTVLDLLGLWDSPALDAYKSRILGRSLLRELDHEQAFPLTNCAGVWTCAFENWGFMRGSHKLQAREWDNEYRCFDVAADPLEQEDLGSAACGDLKARAEKTFIRFPGKQRD